MLAFCGGFQLLVESFGGKLGPLGPQQDGDPVPPPELNFSPGMRQERGYVPVRVLERHPLFEGMATAPVFWQSHFWEVKELPSCFLRLAETPLCSVQAVAHKSLPLYGVQFHAEQYNDEYEDGRRLIERFMSLSA